MCAVGGLRLLPLGEVWKWSKGLLSLSLSLSSWAPPFLWQRCIKWFMEAQADNSLSIPNSRSQRDAMEEKSGQMTISRRRRRRQKGFLDWLAGLYLYVYSLLATLLLVLLLLFRHLLSFSSFGTRNRPPSPASYVRTIRNSRNAIICQEFESSRGGGN